MQACTAVGLGRIIEVKGKPYDPRYEGLTLHDLRRSAIRNLIRARVPDSGHKTRSVFDRYHIVSTEDVAAAMRRVETVNRKTLYGIRKPNGKISANLVQSGTSKGVSH